MGYQRAGFDVVGVDIKPQPNYPFEFHEMDALTVLSYGTILIPHHFDAIHASPPCQRYSSKTRHPENHLDLIGPLRELLAATHLPYVIENVPGSPLRHPVQLCGSSFGLGVRRHRKFENNCGLLSTVCMHEAQEPKYRVYDHGRWYLARTVPVYGTGGGKAREHWPAAMGIDWMTDRELAEAIPPAYTEWIGRQLLVSLEWVNPVRSAAPA